MSMGRSIFYILCICFIVVSCAQASKVTLPRTMPADCQIVLYEIEKDSLSVAYSIDSTTITITKPTGNVWHGGTQKEKLPILKAKVEALYQVILNNQFDRIENKSSGKDSPVKKEVSITVFFDKKSVVVHKGVLQLYGEDEIRFENIRNAILHLLAQARAGNV